MCGRFTLRVSPVELREFFRAVGEFHQRHLYNIAPSQTVAIIREQEGQRTLSGVHWGLIPFWAKESKVGYSMINARSETVASKPSFREPFRKRRCLIPVDGFYEWKREGKEKQPFFIHRPDNGIFSFAGLWDSWKAPDGHTIESCSIITTTPNAMMAEIHDRMPVILPVAAYETWLTAPPEQASSLASLLVPLPDGELTCHSVSKLVNKPMNDVPQCIKPDEQYGICDDTAYFRACVQEREKRAGEREIEE